MFYLLLPSLDRRRLIDHLKAAHTQCLSLPAAASVGNGPALRRVSRPVPGDGISQRPALAPSVLQRPDGAGAGRGCDGDSRVLGMARCCVRVDAPANVSHGGYDPSYFEELASLEDKHFWFRARNRMLSLVVRKLTQGTESGLPGAGGRLRDGECSAVPEPILPGRLGGWPRPLSRGAAIRSTKDLMRSCSGRHQCPSVRRGLSGCRNVRCAGTCPRGRRGTA